MSRTYILPLTKSPWPTGRVGAMQAQDWYRGVVLAKNLLSTFTPSEILILTNVAIPNERSEQEMYAQALAECRVPPEQVRCILDGYETIEQIEIADALARREDAQLVVISTWTHYPRVRWLSRGRKFLHYIAWGIPRPRDLFTDAILTLLFPALDILGLRDRWLESLRKRRISGKF